jgi:hypothetical protein
LKDHETWPKEKRRAWMLENFKLSTSPVLNTLQKVDRAVEFLDGYWDLYSIDGSFCKTNLIEHRIYTEDVPPIKTHHRPINPGLEKNLREQLDKWIEHDVIELLLGALLWWRLQRKEEPYVGALITAYSIK